ncbi:MAG: DUF4956 domain-containing protein [Magnetococcales bacterium]|nr:DUF4956 domain-containing protein [Magnetococcales bacterium]
MNKIDTFNNILSNQSIDISIEGYIINFFLIIVLSGILGWLHSNYSLSVSNRQSIAANLILISCTTMFIIAVVKSSLALSLGLVGALSIVRFRTPIKEPEELAFLFIAISIGLGFGADQRTITLLSFVGLSGVIIARHHLLSKKTNLANLFMSFTWSPDAKHEFEKVVEIMKDNCLAVKLLRLDETSELTEASFNVIFKDVAQLNKNREAIKNLLPGVRIKLIEDVDIH